MFDLIKNKFSNNKDRRTSKAFGETSTLDNIPTIIVESQPRPSTSSTPTGYRSRWASMSSVPDMEFLSAPSSPTTPSRSVSRSASRSASRGRSLSTSSTRTPVQSQPASKSHVRRKRDIFWGSGMWDGKKNAPRGSIVKARSSSVAFVHPEVMEERMRRDNWGL